MAKTLFSIHLISKLNDLSYLESGSYHRILSSFFDIVIKRCSLKALELNHEEVLILTPILKQLNTDNKTICSLINKKAGNV